MTLPSTRRPKEIEAENFMETEEEEEVEQPLKVKFSRSKIFLDKMKTWYRGMSNPKKHRLTPKKLKLRALQVCHEIGIPYNNLPIDWVKTLQTDVGMKLYEKKKVDCDLVPPSLHPSPINGTRASLRRRSNVATTVPNDDANGVCLKSELKVNHGKHRSKKFIDLTKTTNPPSFWLSALAQGITLPRYPTLYSTDDANILFYDYSPKLMDEFGNPIKLVPQQRIDPLEVFSPARNDDQSRVSDLAEVLSDRNK